MSKKLGFIGAGNMANAIIGGILNAKLVPESHITTSKKSENNPAATIGQDIVFLCVKPQVIDNVISQIKDLIEPHQIIVSIAAGKTLEQLQEAFGDNTKIIRVMPNTPVMVGCGMSAIALGKHTTEQDAQFVIDIFNTIGKATILAEGLFHPFIGVAGSSPAYAYMFMDALADAGVAYGLTKADATRFAAQALLGAAKMVLETEKHPILLKDEVCSPGGTTAAAVCELEAQGFRNAIIQSAVACIKKSIDLSK